MARYLDLVDELRRECPEAPSALLESEARASVVDFCKQSRYWREHRVIDLVEGQPDYRLRPSNEGRVDQVLQVIYISNGDWPLAKVDYARTLGQARNGQPRYYAEPPGGGAIRLDPTPDGGQLALYLVLVPARQSRTFPDMIAEPWWEALKDGANARLLMHSNKPWTDPAKAEYLKLQFMRAAMSARQAAVSDQWAPQSVKLRKWV